jgi:hypothetical protein
MPKAIRLPDFPLSGLVPIEKPSGPTSMRTIDLIKPLLCESPLFHDPSLTSPSEKRAEVKRLMKHRGGLKIGQGGTLDPLADGVLVIGLGKGTKLLSQFLHCTKVRHHVSHCNTQRSYFSFSLAHAAHRHTPRQPFSARAQQHMTRRARSFPPPHGHMLHERP